MNSNGIRIIKNTLSLYFRTLILTFISLFTVRIVLDVLGAADYGVYNVVGGFVTMFAFLTNSLSISSQRYFAIHLASDDWTGVSKMFSINLIIYIAFSCIIIVLAETVGLWFVLNRLNYDITRKFAVIVVYETSIVSFVLNVLVSPFLALLIADENLSLYSIISILEGVFKVLVVYFLYTIKGDKLIIYTILIFLTTISIDVFYFLYVKIRYPHLRYSFCKDKKEYKSVFSYLNWNLIGSVAAVFKGQGVNIIINIFFGTTFNAARGVASQVNGVISSFSQNFMKAIDPQITKTYAVKDDKRFWSLINIASKMSFSLLLILSMPVIFNAKYILNLWLKEVPNYTMVFMNLVLIDALISSLTDPILTGVQATGKVKQYQITVGGLNLLNLPLSYALLKIYNNPIVPFVVAIVISVMMGIGRMIVFSKVHSFNVKEYIIRIVFPMFSVSLISVIIMKYGMGFSTRFPEFVIKVIGSIIINTILIICVGLSVHERHILFSFISDKFKKDTDDYMG